MRILWTLFKVILGLAIAIPVGILVMAVTAGVLGTLIGLAITAFRIACIAFVGYGVYRLGRYMFGSSSKISAPPVRELSSRDPYYDAAVRELDAELRR